MRSTLVAMIALFAQTVSGGATVAGRVVDSSGGVMPGVTVTMTPAASGGAAYRTTTNARGEFQLADVAPGRYRGEAVLAGFETDRKEDVVIGAGTTTLSFTLSVRGSLRDVVAELTSHIEKMTGPAPIDCGWFRSTRPRAPSVDELQSVIDCSLKAATAHQPFRAIQQRQGIDSLVFVGFLGASDGAIYVFSYDSAPCGNPGDCDGRFSATACAVPTVSSDGPGRGYLSCRR